MWYQVKRRNLAVDQSLLKIRPIPTDDIYGSGYVLEQKKTDLGSE